MTLGNSLFWFAVGFVSICALGIIVYAWARERFLRIQINRSPTAI